MLIACKDFHDCVIDRILKFKKTKKKLKNNPFYLDEKKNEILKKRRINNTDKEKRMIKT